MTLSYYETEIRSVLKQVVQRDISQLRGDEDLEEKLGLDSLDRLTLAAEVEDRFDLVLSEERLAGLRTLSDIVVAIEATAKEAA
jgi:acyl carrier protein